MKAKIIPIVVLIAMGFFLFNSCEDSTYRIYTGNSPVYMSYDNLRKAVKVEQNAELENPGKIYFKDNYIFIVEELKGIHVYDNSNPASPVRKAFVNLPGVVDISISGYIMYADSFVDLVFWMSRILTISMKREGLKIFFHIRYLLQIMIIL